MKAMIISDSHGWRDELRTVIDRHREEVDLVVHCGDSELDGAAPELEGVRTVKGNCDFGGDFPEERVDEAGGVRFFTGHGHLLNVKMSSLQLKYKGQENEADIVCYGHSHVPETFEEEGLVFINPGSIRLPRGPVDFGTYALAEVSEAEVKVEFFSFEGETVPQLSRTFPRR
ncbi:metallophosphoesterase family protein [Alteribacter natronophilus]|uniref:metallophosphoesterase family protein n=1 Tax=Alteribacter natronophilus TaxID=2583810 RepID=UPI00110E12FE|nr:metallophosphoesterase [Alteribacter natronophilus]TMW71627.1 metallophosphoesterase [Alteribacter natronophilus]